MTIRQARWKFLQFAHGGAELTNFLFDCYNVICVTYEECTRSDLNRHTLQRAIVLKTIASTNSATGAANSFYEG